MSSDHIEKCRQLYYATLKVPADLRDKLGRTKFKQSLGTGDRRRAVELARPVVALWKAQLRQAQGEPNAVQQEALRWREALAVLRKAEEASGVDLGPHEAEAAELAIIDRAEALEAQRGLAAAQEFAGVALGHRTPSRLHWDSWEASIGRLVQKSQDQYKADVGLLVNRFPTLEEMTPQALRQWADELATRSKVTPSSLKRMVSCWRSYWAHLVDVQAVPADAKPFALVKVQSRAKRATGNGKGGWVPFPAADVPKLWAIAEGRGDAELRDLIKLGAYTGARIEELCALQWEHMDPKLASFRIVDSKTGAGVREVPVHPELVPLLRRLKKAKQDDYVLGGLTFNKYGDRSNAIGKRFGRLKASLGYGEAHVFHSLRKTLVTLLEDAGVSENLAADIVGHEKPRITYGLYSGGASLATKAEALALVKYPG